MCAASETVGVWSALVGYTTCLAVLKCFGFDETLVWYETTSPIFGPLIFGVGYSIGSLAIDMACKARAGKGVGR